MILLVNWASKIDQSIVIQRPVWKKTKGGPKFKLFSNFFILIIIIFIWIVYTVNSFRSDAAICKCSIEKLSLTLTVPCISESCIEIKIKLNCYFHTPLWCLKRFYEGLKAFIKPSEAPQRIVKIKFNSFFSFRPGRVNILITFTGTQEYIRGRANFL